MIEDEFIFNLSTYSGIIDEDRFWVQGRIIPQLHFPPRRLVMLAL